MAIQPSQMHSLPARISPAGRRPLQRLVAAGRQKTMDEQRVEAVWGLACFQGWDGERWTEAEMAPVVAALRGANEAARRFFGIRSSEPKGLEVGWDFSKRDGTSGPRFWTRKWT
jgi:hypothetical protein